MTSVLFPWFRQVPTSGCAFTKPEHDDRIPGVRYPNVDGEGNAWRVGETSAVKVTRAIALGSAAIAALLLVLPPAAQAAPDRPGPRAGWQERMVVRLNAVRADAGSPPVRLCAALTRSAQSYAEQMSRDNRFSHTASDGSTSLQRVAESGYRPRLVGENLAAGQPTVAAAMADWRRSSPHHATMTDPRFRHVGFGYAAGRSPRYATFWVQHFGTGAACR